MVLSHHALPLPKHGWWGMACRPSMASERTESPLEIRELRDYFPRPPRYGDPCDLERGRISGEKGIGTVALGKCGRMGDCGEAFGVRQGQDARCETLANQSSHVQPQVDR